MALRKIDLMHKVFGRCPGRRCKDCSNLVKVRVSDMALTKCKVYGLTHSQASDWVQRYEACGMFNKPWGENQTPIIRLVTPENRKEQETKPIEGQMSFEER